MAAVPVAVLSVLKKLSPASTADAAINEVLASVVIDDVSAVCRFDAVIDMDLAVRDPAAPDALLTAYDSGDHLHPNDAGLQAIANAVNLQIFSRSMARAATATKHKSAPSGR